MSTDPTDRRVQTVALSVLAVVAAGFALNWLRPVLIPFVLAVFLTWIIEPVVGVGVRRLRMPRWLSLVVALLIGFVVLTAVGALVSSSVKQLAGNSAAYQQRLLELADRATSLLAGFGFDTGVDALRDQLASLPFGSMLMKTTGALVDMLSNTFLVLVFTVYLLIGQSDHNTNENAGDNLWAEIDRRVQGYIVTKVALSAATGIATWLILAVLGIDLALVFGVMAFVLNFIPNVGSIIATLLPLPIVAVSPDISPLVATLAIALPGVVQLVVGNVIEPKVIGDSLELHPITILLALILWGMLWGMVGMVLAAPITAVLRLLLDQFDSTRPIAAMMAGQMDAIRGRAAPPSPTHDDE